MSTTTIAQTEIQAPERRNWTGEEFDRLAELGFFGPEERLELNDGEIVEKTTQNSTHATALRLTEKALNKIFASGYDIRSQMPLRLGSRDRPEPDVAVVLGDTRDYARSHPRSAILVVEISDSTLVFDQTKKQGLYARAGIPEYWIVNLRDRLLEVYRQPISIPGYPLGHGYQQVLRLTETDSVTPLSEAEESVPVADLFP
jgi:Uma2 family endonuclease